MLVKDWMTPAPLTVAPSTTVLEALKLLKSRGFRRLPVVDGAVLLGIVTEKDLKDALPSKANTLSVWELNQLLGKLAVREVMTSNLKTCRAADTLEGAALTMQAAKIAGLPVLDGAGALVGMLTVTDVLGAFTQVLGLKEGGVRLTLEMPDVPGSLIRATEAIQPANIVSVATAGASNGRRKFVIRAVGQSAAELEERLHQAGIDVTNLQ